MPQLHLTRAAAPCRTLAALETRLAARAAGGEVRIATRYRPRRADELAGGALHWIVQHRIVARMAILRFDDRADGRTDIVCSAQLERIAPQPCRAHQGWRYYQAETEVIDGDDDVAALPPALYGRLAALLLV